MKIRPSPQQPIRNVAKLKKLKFGCHGLRQLVHNHYFSHYLSKEAFYAQYFFFTVGEMCITWNKEYQPALSKLSTFPKGINTHLSSSVILSYFGCPEIRRSHVKCCNPLKHIRLQPSLLRSQNKESWLFIGCSQFWNFAHCFMHCICYTR